jgi:hypothetical protein
MKHTTWLVFSPASLVAPTPTAVDLRIGIAVGVGIANGIERNDHAIAAYFSIPIPIATPTPNAPSS